MVGESRSGGPKREENQEISGFRKAGCSPGGVDASSEAWKS